jgi:hypothetical protein
MDAGERTSGTRDEQYNLIAGLYHALHGAEDCEVYAVDAEAASGNDRAAFFREAGDIQRALADRAKGLLGIGPGTVSGAPGADGVTMLGAAETGTQISPRTKAPSNELVVATEELPPSADAPDTVPGPSGTASASGEAPKGDVAPPIAQAGWEALPPSPGRASPQDVEPLDKEAAPEGEVVPPDAPRTEEPPPRTGDAPPSPSEQPPK